MNKCTGCGAILQNDNKDEIGYCKNLENNLCERCFRIINYNEYKEIVKENDEFIKILEKINLTKDLVIVVIDLLNINKIENILKYITNDKIIVLTKRDVIPKSVKDEKLIEYVNNCSSNVKDVLVISSKKNYNFDLLFDSINMHKKTKKVYVIGYTNSGKSTMINKLIYNYSNENTKITTSMLPNTTVDLIEVKINDELILIDTPGILDEGNIINYIDKKNVKKLLPKKEIKPITYQLKKQDILSIEDIIKIESITDSNLTIFISNSFKIQRIHNNKCNLDYINLNVLSGEDIVINGLGFIKVTKDCTLKIYISKNVEIYKRKSLI